MFDEDAVTAGNTDAAEAEFDRFEVEHDPVNHPRHYRHPLIDVQCIEISRCLPSDLGQAVQYVWRHDTKNGIEDMRKAAWFLSDAIKHPNHQRVPAEIHDEGMRKLADVADAEWNAAGRAMGAEQPWRSRFYDEIVGGRMWTAAAVLDVAIRHAQGDHTATVNIEPIESETN